VVTRGSGKVLGCSSMVVTNGLKIVIHIALGRGDNSFNGSFSSLHHECLSSGLFWRCADWEVCGANVKDS
jgi:hypothetical protein